jgi:3-dehydroquinate synthase
MNSKNIEVSSASGSYTVTVGSGILKAEIERVFKDEKPDAIYLITDENVQKLHGQLITSVLEPVAGELHRMEVPEGERSKSIEFWEKITGFLLMKGIRRNTPVIVIGGGVTGDVGGFAAASVLRGVPLYHIPTTLLAMVDSSIGGKTGVNHEQGKNLIGAFYQPEGVIADIEFLKTLPANEWVNGLSEVLKYGAISDASIFTDSEIFLADEPVASNPQKLTELISKCITVKAEIVKKDEFESGVRGYLNFGHTFAHSLERACGYEKISHGEAVFLGMMAAITLSNLTGSHLEVNPLKKFSNLYRYRVSEEELSLDELRNNMASDKKRTDQFIRFVLLNSWQHPVLKTVKDSALIREAWNTVFDELS